MICQHVTIYTGYNPKYEDDATADDIVSSYLEQTAEPKFAGKFSRRGEGHNMMQDYAELCRVYPYTLIYEFKN